MSIGSMPGEDDRMGGVVAPSVSIGGVITRPFSGQHTLQLLVNGTLMALTAVISRLEEVLREERPPWRWSLRTATIVSIVQAFS